MTELYLRNVFRLNPIYSEACHKIGNDVRVLFGFAYYFYCFIYVKEYFSETEQQMKLFAFFAEVEIQSAAYALHSEFYPFVDYRPHAEKARLAVDKHVEVAGKIVLQGSFPEQLCHKHIGIRSATDIERQLEAVKVYFVAHVRDFFELTFFYHIRELFEYKLDRRGVRNFDYFYTA